MVMHPTDLTLNDYVDGSLSDTERGRVADHLRECAQCRGLVADFTDIRRTATSLGPIEPADRVWTAVERSLRESDAASGTPSRVVEPVATTPRTARRFGAGFRTTPSGSGGFGLTIGSWQLAGATLVAAALVAAVFVGLRIGRQQ